MNCIGPFIIRRHSVFKIIINAEVLCETAAVRIRFPTLACDREVVARSGCIGTVDIFDILVRITYIFRLVVGKV